MKPLLGTELKRFLRDYKRAHPPSRQIALLLQSIEYPYNVGGIFRLADGAGITELVLTGITPTPPHPTIDKVGRFKSRQLAWRYEKEPVTAAKSLKEQGYHLIALELTDTAVPYHTYTYPAKVCLVAGHEDHGVTKAVLAQCEAAVFLPMYGHGRSLNVYSALSILTYHIRHS